MISGVTAYHAQYFALELLKRCASGTPDRFAGALMDAKVDLNPHQVDAALFAFQSPLSQGAVLADEVGLGKTIEAGLVLAQFWAERKRRILVILPASLRMQWHQEMQEKFFLPAQILESRSFNAEIKAGRANPFDRPAHTPSLVMCSYNFARNKAREVAAVPWDLVVLDEAHRLRNVYKTSNKIARELKECLQHRRKILLTATPLQNSLLELYGLVSFVDDFVFGDQRSFQAQFGNLGSTGDFSTLQQRLAPVCKRTLRKQVLEYIKYTNRRPLTIQFHPTDEEHELYELVSEYLRRPSLQALPAGQRSLMTLVLRKLLASSTHAIAGALETITRRLRERVREHSDAAKKAAEIKDELAEDYEELADTEEEWDEPPAPEILSPEDLAALEGEIEELEAFRDRATAIEENEKGNKLLTALEQGFAEAARLGAAQKAVVFTESRRTQDYLVRVLADTPYAERIVLFNGSNNDPRAQEIHREWAQRHAGSDRMTGSRAADTRAALVDYFRDSGQILIATEAAAEGINLQFCSLVVNYDLPWNPQRIEQRIGRCHRYGQLHDVVVVNFLNQRNAADQRVFQLLSEKFRLFSGVFGASDEVLGSIESGVDFERRIADIYQNCRTSQDIQTEFDFLQKEMDENIRVAMSDTRRRLLENFDDVVLDRLRNLERDGRDAIGRYEAWLWAATSQALAGRAEFLPGEHAFDLRDSPLPADAPPGRYVLARHATADGEGHAYRLGHPLARHLLSRLCDAAPGPAHLIFDTQAGVRVSSLQSLAGCSGSLLVAHLALDYPNGDGEDHVLLAASTDDGTSLDAESIRDLFRLPARVEPLAEAPDAAPLIAQRDAAIAAILVANEERNAGYFDEETAKLDGWAEDMKQSLERELKQLDAEIRDTKKERKTAPDLAAKLECERRLRSLEHRRSDRRRALFEEQDKVDVQRDHLISDVERRLQQRRTPRDVFTIRWTLA